MHSQGMSCGVLVMQMSLVGDRGDSWTIDFWEDKARGFQGPLGESDEQ